MAFTLPDLPFAKDSLAPHISAETFDFHHGKHHNAYIGKANELIAGTQFETMTAEEIIVKTADSAEHGALFNNVAQHWNHTFFWYSLSPEKQEIPTALEEKIKESFGSVDSFKESFINAGIGQFGSGWVWLVKTSQGGLEIIKTANAETPLSQGHTPLLTCDVWEHAYYLDFQNRRPDFLKTFINDLVNWNFALENWENNGFVLSS
jgi:Fe-Mn family superoxide dismutase